jgi:Family of unknown function (DUF5670)
MLETIAIVMVVLWLLGIVTSNTMGGFIHALLVIAVEAYKDSANEKMSGTISRHVADAPLLT